MTQEKRIRKMKADEQTTTIFEYENNFDLFVELTSKQKQYRESKQIYGWELT